MKHLDRYTRTVTLALFLVLLLLATYPMYGEPAVDLFLRLDPLVAIGTSLVSGTLLLAVIPGLIVLVSALIMGRAFCGHVCPMGTTIDLFGKAVPTATKQTAKTNAYESCKDYRHWKYLFLTALTGAAVAGVSLIYWGSPLSLVTRIYGLVLYPLGTLVTENALQIAAPRFFDLGLHRLAFLEIPVKVFATNALVVLIAGGVILASRVQTRFWCRNLCPSGALLGLCSWRPLLRRVVNDDCTRCGQCVKECPTGAIGEDPHTYVPAECIVCNRCVEICPESAVRFQAGRQLPAAEGREIDLGRRGVLAAGVVGLFSAGIVKTDLKQPSAVGSKHPLRAEDLIRPPGALPEPDFLKRCIRCGECMKACPTNTLQPVWLKAGLDGLFSPVLVPRHGACAVNCNVCGRVCPTGAIRSLDLREKNQAKIGTAWIVRQNCLVWEQDKKCLVCDEVCPYNAVAFRPISERKNPVPFVLENRCIGCGWCENKCPVGGASAIRVNIIGEIRLADGSYREKAAEFGLKLKAKNHTSDRLGQGTFESTRPSITEEPPKRPESSEEGTLPGGFIVK